jgi:hypothetical protein
MSKILRYIGWDKDTPIKTIPMWTGGFVQDRDSGGLMPDIRYIPNEKTINDVADDHVPDGSFFYKQRKGWHTIDEAKRLMPEVAEAQWVTWLIPGKSRNIKYWQCNLCSQRYPANDKTSIQGHILLVHGGEDKYNAKIQSKLDLDVESLEDTCSICGFTPPDYDKKGTPMSDAMKKQSMRMHKQSAHK